MLINNDSTMDFAEKVLEGTRRAVKKLVEETAAKDGTLVIGDANGVIKEVPAKELLPLLQDK